MDKPFQRKGAQSNTQVGRDSMFPGIMRNNAEIMGFIDELCEILKYDSSPDNQEAYQYE
jgi:hypothetical protein